MVPAIKEPIKIRDDRRFRNPSGGQLDMECGTNGSMARLLRNLVPLGEGGKEKKIFSALVSIDRSNFVDGRFWHPYKPFCGAPIMPDGAERLDNNELSIASAPFTVVHTLKLAGDIAGQKVAEVGSGSGYQTALLARLAGEQGKVLASELITQLIERAKKSILSCTSGGKLIARTEFFPSTTALLQNGPFDALIFCCAIDLDTLREMGGHVRGNGRVIAPVQYEGDSFDYLTRYTPDNNTAVRLINLPRQFVRFKPESDAPMR